MEAVNLPDVDVEIAGLAPTQRAWIGTLLASDPGHQSTHLYRPVDKVSRTRLINLVRYLRSVRELGCSVALVGEAPGHIGTRRTGIPFMSEAIVRGLQPIAEDFVARARFMASSEDLPVRREVSSTIVWTTLEQLPQLPYLWAVYPHHPFQVGQLHSNRTPTPVELVRNRDVVLQFLDAFAVDRVVAVGSIAERALNAVGVPCHRVRHPARGGASEFRDGVIAELA